MQNHRPKQSTPNVTAAGAQRVLVATTAMLVFISFWRAAAVVLNDMGSSAFYAGAIAEHFVGKTAPWFVLAIMLLSFAVRSVYIESCSMFVRGGGGHGRNAGEVLGFGSDVRLHPDWTN
jgi:Amino acid permease